MFDLWETALVDVLNEQLSKLGVKVISSHDSRGDLTIIFPNKEEMKKEMIKGEKEEIEMMKRKRRTRRK